MQSKKPLIFPQIPKDDRRSIMVLTVNADNISCLIGLLESLNTKIGDGEMEGCGGGCKWWINERKVDD